MFAVTDWKVLYPKTAAAARAAQAYDRLTYLLALIGFGLAALPFLSFCAFWFRPSDLIGDAIFDAMALGFYLLIFGWMWPRRFALSTRTAALRHDEKTSEGQNATIAGLLGKQRFFTTRQHAVLARILMRMAARLEALTISDDDPITRAIGERITKVRDEMRALTTGFEGIDGAIARTPFGVAFLERSYKSMQALEKDLSEVEEAVDFYITANKLDTAEGRSVALDIVVAKLRELGISPDFSRP